MSASESFANSPLQSTSTSLAKVSYRKMGAGPAIVFVHGWPLHSATYRDVARLLSKRYTCYLPDLPGAGNTPAYKDQRHVIQKFTNTLIEFADSLELEEFALIGHDSGGAIARWVAAELGDRITALILSNTELTGHTVPFVTRFARFTRLPGSVLFLRALFSFEKMRLSKFGFAGCFSNRTHISGEFHDLFMKPLLSDYSKFKTTMTMLSQIDFDELANFGPVHAKINVPTRFVWGARDRFFPIAAAKEMSREFSAFDKFVVVDDGKLFFHEEFPQLFADAAAPLLDSVVASPTKNRPAANVRD